MLELLGQAALRTMLLAIIVKLGLFCFRRPQLRLIAWTVVLAASLAMPILQWGTPLRLAILPNLSSIASIEAADPPPHAPASQKSVPVVDEEVMAPTMAVPWLEIGYYLVAGFFLLRLSLGLALSLRLLARAVPVCPAWAGDTSIRISRDIAAPVTVAHVILLPWDAVNWPAGMRTAVLAHERAHLARWDFAMLVASQVNRAVFWFSPLSWWLHRRLATLAELASDDQAMATTGDRLGYATILLEMGRRSGASLRGVAMARPSTLRYRIERILADGVTTDSVRPIEQVMLALGAAGFSIFAASSGPVPVDAGWPAPMPSSPVQITSALQASPVSVPMAALVAPMGRLVAAPAAAALVPRKAARAAMPLRSHVVAQRSQDMHRVVSGGSDQADVSSGPSVETPPVHRAGVTLAAVQRNAVPSCTGVYLPPSGAVRTDGAVDIVQARYFQQSDGTPWLRLLLGTRSRAILTGFEVERISYRATVVTRLPRDTDHVTGTTSGSYGAINFDCAKSGAQS